MTNRLKTVPAHSFIIEGIEHRPSSELEAMMVDDEQNWSGRDESVWDIVDDVLTEEERQVVDLIVFGGWSFRMVAKELGISVGKAHSLKTRAFAKLEVALRGKVE